MRVPDSNPFTDARFFFWISYEIAEPLGNDACAWSISDRVVLIGNLS